MLTYPSGAGVIIGLPSIDRTEGGVTPSDLSPTAANSRVPQAITLPGVVGLFIDGDVAYTPVFVTTISSGPISAGPDVADASADHAGDETSEQEQGCTSSHA